MLALREDGAVWTPQSREGASGREWGIRYQADQPIIGVYSAGSRMAYLLEDGTLMMEGENYWGALGTGTWPDVEFFKPVAVATDVVNVVMTTGNTFIVKSDNSLWCCGKNPYGVKLFPEATGDYSLSFVKLMDDVKQITSSGNVLVLKTDDTLWGLGESRYGAFGTGKGGNSERNTLLTKITEDVIGISCNGGTTYYVKKDGTLWGMGRNDRGQIGNGRVIDPGQFDGEFVPVKILDDVVYITPGSADAIAALTESGDVYIWGANRNYIMGNGKTTVEMNTPPYSIITNNDILSLP